MNETEFNAALRGTLRVQGLKALHIREADETGVSDLVIWQGRTLVAWAELKVDNHELEGAQHQFLLDREKESGNAYLIRFSNTSGLTRVSRPVAEGVLHVATVDNFRLTEWTAFFKWHRREV